MNSRYVHLCKPSVKSTEWLFWRWFNSATKPLSAKTKCLSADWLDYPQQRTPKPEPFLGSNWGMQQQYHMQYNNMAMMPMMGMPQQH